MTLANGCSSTGDTTNVPSQRKLSEWWDESGELFAIGVLLNDMRIPYFHDAILARYPNPTNRLSLLDVGCGGGSLSLALAGQGFQVTGIDPDQHAIDNAIHQGELTEFQMEFHECQAEMMPFPDETFDVVICSEVLEHVVDLQEAILEMSRVLRSGGLLLFSMPNRTMFSHLLLIKFAQEWRITRVMTAVEHEFEKLIQPNELRTRLRSSRIEVGEICGVSIPVPTLPRAFSEYVRYKLGFASLAELAQHVRLKVGGSQKLAYIGWGIKNL